MFLFLGGMVCWHCGWLLNPAAPHSIQLLAGLHSNKLHIVRAQGTSGENNPQKLLSLFPPAEVKSTPKPLYTLQMGIPYHTADHPSRITPLCAHALHCPSNTEILPEKSLRTPSPPSTQTEADWSLKNLWNTHSHFLTPDLSIYRVGADLMFTSSHSAHWVCIVTGFSFFIYILPSPYQNEPLKLAFSFSSTHCFSLKQ